MKQILAGFNVTFSGRWKQGRCSTENGKQVLQSALPVLFYEKQNLRYEFARIFLAGLFLASQEI